ncbi:hypothetical protein QJ856_gp0513 [Tupanvirus deep ocean]|uniref:Uncharacterized protein n=1 Tax=Tupanvirus soda lake TaxID=2126985 RepID=A0A2K9L1J7_9VIRU|nr:hypothetical protein QJ856_gp0513 [Tupanvirus deep ocean]AUL79600.2 hypothetical protein [Tupanvirus deep ocean]
MKDYNAVTTTFEKFDELVISDLNKEACQWLAFISDQNEKPFVVVTEPIKITAGGIPKLNEHYCQEDINREFINIAFDITQPSCLKLKLFFEKADNYFDSDTIRKRLFGSKADRYEYQPIIKIKTNYDDDDDYPHKNKPKRPDYCKVKFLISQCGNKRKITTRFKEFGNEMKLDTVTKMAEKVRFFKTYTFAICIRKIWANRIVAPGADKIFYGVGLSMVEITMGSPYIDFGKPIYDINGIKLAYKKYMDDKKKSIKTNLTVEV